MGLSEKWEKESTEAREEKSTYGYDCNDTVHLSAVATTLDACAADLESACTPRPPKVEYFGAPVDADGKPTKKWDSWMLQHRDGSWFLVRGAWIERGMIFTPGGSDPIESIVACIPVRREGPPAMDVGWDVV